MRQKLCEHDEREIAHQRDCVIWYQGSEGSNPTITDSGFYTLDTSNNVDAINRFISNKYASGGTPMGDALEEAKFYIKRTFEFQQVCTPFLRMECQDIIPATIVSTAWWRIMQTMRLKEIKEYANYIQLDTN